MDDGRDTLIKLKLQIRDFVCDRNWEQFHTPKNLAISLCVEAAELLEPFQWMASGDSQELSDTKRKGVAHEMADVLIYLIRLADKLDIDLSDAVREKLEINAKKYPADRVYGDPRKYDEYQ
jgi:NTP pyrophosphatase (non-canonical NTP hydrolase)